ncbi:hypothetical protein PV326_002900 [Microctonus aethiopoides]|nr:hypothetical protein PV326_002900 [Microctonus aethiopoides]
MKNLGSRWTGPNIPRTAVARSLLVVAISPKDIGRRIRHKIIRDKHQTRRRSIVVAVGDKIDCENTRSNPSFQEVLAPTASVFSVLVECPTGGTPDC